MRVQTKSSQRGLREAFLGRTCRCLIPPYQFGFSCSYNIYSPSEYGTTWVARLHSRLAQFLQSQLSPTHTRHIFRQDREHDLAYTHSFSQLFVSCLGSSRSGHMMIVLLIMSYLWGLTISPCGLRCRSRCGMPIIRRFGYPLFLSPPLS